MNKTGNFMIFIMHMDGSRNIRNSYENVNVVDMICFMQIYIALYAYLNIHFGARIETMSFIFSSLALCAISSISNWDLESS